MKRSLQLLRRSIGAFGRTSHRRPVEAKASVASKFSSAWQSEEIPERQWSIVEAQLARLTMGEVTSEFSTFLRAVSHVTDAHGLTPTTLLELGSSSGYYREVLHSRFPHIDYTGIDFSKSFIEFGTKKFPGIDLRSGDTTNLDISACSFDVVVSGSVLLHVFDWERGVSESCRVARQALVLHRTPVTSGPTTLFTKTAYGQKMIEWTFNEGELLSTCDAHNFVISDKWPVYDGDVLGADPASPTQFTYVLVRSS